MEENEDEPEDVRQAGPVDEELVKAGIDEESSSPVPEYPSQRAKAQQMAKGSSKRSQKPIKTKEECCEQKLKKYSKNSKTPKTVTVLVNEKECIMKKVEIPPRHCLSRKEWMDFLSKPSPRCPPCLKRKVERKLRPVSQRINELARPTKQRMLSTLEDRGSILPAELVDKLINILEGETCLTPEQAERLFRDNQLKQQSKKIQKHKKEKCEADMKIPKFSGHVPSLNFDKDAVTCQYLMAEAFVKSILQWKCQIPKEEFKDIADIIVKRLATILEYNLVDSGDRTTQQIRFLGDIIAAWIAGVLFEVAENQRDEIEKEREERKKKKEEEETPDESTVSEDDEYFPPRVEESIMEEPMKEEKKEDKEDNKPKDKDEDKKRSDDKKDDDDDAGAGGAAIQERPNEEAVPEIPDANEQVESAADSPDADGGAAGDEPVEIEAAEIPVENDKFGKDIESLRRASTPRLGKDEEELDESKKLSTIEIETEVKMERIGAPISKKPGPQNSDFIEDKLKKILQTDLSFLDLLRILDRIENAAARDGENVGDDAMIDTIHREIYEELKRLVNSESPEKLTEHSMDVLDLLSGKIAEWIRNIMTDSENPPVIESTELRGFDEWLGDMSDRANTWTMWMHRMISQLVSMQGTQITHGDWQDWTRNFKTGALKWRNYYLEAIHHADHNQTMLAGGEPVKTGELRYPEWSIQEKQINTTKFL